MVVEVPDYPDRARIMIDRSQPMPIPTKPLRPGRRAGTLAGLLIASILLIAPFARPEERLRDDFGPKLSSVELNDFDEEVDLFIREAEDAEIAGDYEKATELYQEAARTAPQNYVVRVAPRTYLGAKELVKSRIAAWPEKGIETYRRLIGPRVREIEEGALERDDVRALNRVVREFPHAAEAPGVMLALADRALTRGDLDIALRHTLEILRLYPEGPIPGVARRDVLARAGVAAAKLGDRLMLEEIRARAAKLPKDTVVAVAGGSQPLTAFLDGLMIVSPSELAPEGWTGVGGGPARRGGRDGPTGPLTRYFTVHDQSSNRGHDFLRPPETDQSSAPPLHPLIGAGSVILPGHGAIRSFKLPEPGKIPGHRDRDWAYPPGEPEDEPDPDAQVVPIFGAIADGLLTIPYRDPSIGFYGEMPRESLVTLDIRTGSLLDARGAGDPRPEGMEDLPYGLEFCGSPAIANDRVYVTGYLKRHLVETFVLCFDSGGRRGGLRLRWITSVCMGEGHRNSDYSRSLDEQRMEASSVTIRNGLAYLCSNTGAVAALEADTGEIVWLHTYQQAKRHMDLFAQEVRTTTTWQANPPMLDHRLLYVTPIDADRLFIYHQRPDLETGYVVYDHFGRDQIVNGFDPEYMLGVRDGVAYLAGTTRSRGERPLFAVKSGPLAPRARGEPADQQRILWRAEIEEDAPAGRGVLAGDFIYFPTEKGIYRVAIADGKATRLLGLSDFPDEDSRDGAAHPIGNLAVSGPWLVTAGEKVVTVFGPLPDEKDKPESGD